MSTDKYASMPYDLVGDKKPTSASTAFSYRYICTPLEGPPVAIRAGRIELCIRLFTRMRNWLRV